MTPIEKLTDAGRAPVRPRKPFSTRKKIYYGCMLVFAIGTAARIALMLYWHRVMPHVVDVASGRTHPLGGHGALVFLTQHQSHGLVTLQVASWIFFLVGSFVWASAWREW